MLRALQLSILFTVATLEAVSAQQSCGGEKPIRHDDGNYTFNTRSWVSAGAGVYHYGRCVEVVDPTKKLLHTWESVLPPYSIAREGRPTISGYDFVTKNSKDASALLHYGNTDDNLLASYIAHAHEVPQTAQQQGSNEQSAIKEALEKYGQLVLRAFHQVSFLLAKDDEESVADLEVTFRSQREGTSHTYIVEYFFDIPSDRYSDRSIYLSFAEPSMNVAMTQATKQESLEVKEGKDAVFFSQSQAEDSHFVQSSLTISDSNGQRLTELPITYLTPVR